MSAQVHFIAYASGNSLREDVDTLIRNVESGSKASQKQLAAHAFETAAREVLKTFVGDLAQQLQDPARPNRDVQKTLASVDQHVGSFCRLLVNFISNDKLPPVMRHFSTLLLDVDDARGPAQPWVGFRVDTGFVAEYRAVIAHLRDPAVTRESYDGLRACRLLDDMMDRMLDIFLEQPKKLMDFGFVMRKAADTAIGMIRNGMHGMMRKTIPHLNAQQRARLADHLEHLLLSLPADRYV